MNKTAAFAAVIVLAFLGCSKDAKLPPKVFETALARTISLSDAQAANLSGLQRSLYGSARDGRYYCVDFIAKKSMSDLIIVTVYDDTTGSFRRVEGGRVVSDLVLEVNGEQLKPQKTYVLLVVQQAAQSN